MTESDYFPDIQCPECGGLLMESGGADFECSSCHRPYSEDEVRARCGL
jgi:tRNA(Ile2) C34 agmatinyltransferase TiaS